MRHSPAGFTTLELLLSVAVAATLLGITVSLTGEALDHVRTAMAARYVEGRIMEARMQAVRRSARVGLRFEASNEDYVFGTYVDGNGNGVRTADIAAGIDSSAGPREMLRDRFAGVAFALGAGVPDVDGRADGTDGVRLGAARILTLGPDGTATSGTLYIRGRRAQYAVRVLGATGRTRLLHFDTGARRWSMR